MNRPTRKHTVNPAHNYWRAHGGHISSGSSPFTKAVPDNSPMPNCRPTEKHHPLVSICIANFNGESILTEYSHKYSIDGFQRLAAAVGFRGRQVWTDPEPLFAVCYLDRA